MMIRTADELPRLDEQDETAWLARMSELVREGRADEPDLAHLAAYHAEFLLAGAFADAVERAAAETGRPVSWFPQTCPYTIERRLILDPESSERD